MFCGLLVALSVSLRLAVRDPIAVGLKVTLMTQLAPAFSVAGAVPQVVLDTKKSFVLNPVMLQEKLVKGAPPVLVTVSDFV
jgi:hypothetical protein